MRAFISQMIPQDSLSRETQASQAANNFCMNFINAVNIDLAIFLIPIFVKNKIAFKYNFTIPYKIVQSRIFPQKYLGVFFNLIIENIKLFKIIRVQKIQNIWFYNLTIHNAISFILIKWIIKRKCFILFADSTPIKKKYDINRFINWLILKSDGIISLSHKSDFIKNHTNLSLLSGIIGKNQYVIQNRKINRKDILFSGYLRSHAGIHLALETFVKNSDLNLIVTGRGDEEKLVQAYSVQNSNIKYLGFLEFNDYLNLLNNVDIVLNLRDPFNQENLYNFPSKMIESLIQKKVVVSTIKYPQIAEDVYFYTPYDTESLLNTLLKILELDDATLNKIMDKSHLFASRSFSAEAWLNVVNKVENSN